MADISKLKLPNNNTYDIKDATGRAYIGDLSALITTAKNNLVEAINEAAQVVASLENYVQKSGDTMTGALTTTALTVGSRASNNEVGNNSFTQGVSNVASGNGSYAGGCGVTAIGNYSHAEGYGNFAKIRAHAEGQCTLASGNQSHAEGGSSSGTGTLCKFNESYPVGTIVVVLKKSRSDVVVPEFIQRDGIVYQLSNETVVSETDLTYQYTINPPLKTAIDASSGYYDITTPSVIASGACSHAEGDETIASGTNSHAEGNRAMASGNQSHAEGYGTKASGYASHAEGASASALGKCAHAGGQGTVAGYDYQFVIGQYNNNQEDSVFEIGGGTSLNKKNIFRIDANGHIENNFTTLSYTTVFEAYTASITMSTSVYCFKKDQKLVFNFVFTLASALNNGSYVRVGTMKTGYIPKVAQAGVVCYQHTQYRGIYYLNRTGVLYFRNTSGSSIAANAQCELTLEYEIT